MNNRDSERWAARIGDRRAQILENQRTLGDEILAARGKNRKTGRDGCCINGKLSSPGPTADGPAGMAALAAAFYDVVTEGEGVERMGIWYDVDDPSDRVLDDDERKRRLASVSFHAKLERVRNGGGLPLNTLRRCWRSLTPVTPTVTIKRAASPKRPRMKEPSKKAWQAWHCRNLYGETQQKLMERMIANGVRCSQGTVCRWLIAVEAWRDAGGAVPPLPDPRCNAAAVNPAVIDQGGRTDGLTKRQRIKPD